MVADGEVYPSQTQSLVFIVACAAAFAVLEHLLLWRLTPWFATLSRNDKRQKTGAAHVLAIQGVTKITVTLHNLVQIPLAALLLGTPTMCGDHLHAHTTLSILMVHISSGYFLQDLVNCIMRFSMEGPLFLLHASCCFLVFTYMGLTGFGHYYGAAFLMWECSTLFVHLRWLLIKLGHGAGSAFAANSAAMVVTFFCCRILWGYHTSHRYYLDTRGELARPPGSGVIPPAVIHFFLGANVCLNGLNTYWFWLMGKGAVQALAGKDLAVAGRLKND